MWEWGHHQRYDRYDRYDRYNYERLEYLGHPARDCVLPRARAFLVAAKRRADFEGCHNRDVVGGVRHIWNRLLERWRFEGVTENEPLRLMDGEIRWSRVSRVVKMVTAVPVLTHLIEERVGATEVTEVAEVPVLTHLIEERVDAHVACRRNGRLASGQLLTIEGERVQVAWGTTQ